VQRVCNEMTEQVRALGPLRLVTPKRVTPKRVTSPRVTSTWTVPVERADELVGQEAP